METNKSSMLTAQVNYDRDTEAITLSPLSCMTVPRIKRTKKQTRAGDTAQWLGETRAQPRTRV